jgi:hypothetical protein
MLTDRKINSTAWGKFHKTFYGRNYVAIGITESNL